MEKKLKKVIKKNREYYPLHIRNTEYFLNPSNPKNMSKCKMESIQCDDFDPVYVFYKKISLIY
jgi:hypothetical protein